MIIDTTKTNCSNCKYYQKYNTPKEVILHLLPKSPGTLMACNGVVGFGIVGPNFYCMKYERK